MTEPAQFTLNGKTVDLSGCEPTESLLRWLRRERLSGTKEGCADGDCGACTVAMIDTDDCGTSAYRAINSCLLPLGAAVGRDIITVEYLSDGESLHPVQRALVECSGSQCGYCTPGFVMSLFAGYYAGELDDHTTEGNLCRCTGYAPIRRATVALHEVAGQSDRFTAALQQAHSTEHAAQLGSYFIPGTVDQAVALKQRHPQSAWIAGATDLGVNLSHGQTVAPVLIALDRIAELQHIEVDETTVRIGAGVTLSRLEREIGGLITPLDEMLRWFAARQVKNRATFGGNLGSASPIGDLLPILLALDAQIELVGPLGERTLAATDFFLAYRKTVRADDELVRAVRIPRRQHITAAYKVAKRQSDDISIVAGVFAVDLDAEHRVRHVRLAYGGVAAIPVRAVSTEQWMLGRVLDKATMDECATRLAEEFSPLSDHRAGAGYRRALCGSLFAKFVAEHCA